MGALIFFLGHWRLPKQQDGSSKKRMLLLNQTVNKLLNRYTIWPHIYLQNNDIK